MARAAHAFHHEALFYAGQDEFLAGTSAFIRHGLAAEEPVLVIVCAAKIGHLRAELGGDADRVLFADMAEVGTNPARIIPAWRQFVDDHSAPGRGIRGIGEPIWAGRSAAELVECQRHESLLNLAFADSPDFRLLCPYDLDTLDADVLDEAERSHPVVGDPAGGQRVSAGCRSLDAVAAPFDAALPDPPSGHVEFAFGSDGLGALRTLVAGRATEAGVAEQRTHDLVLAVHEIASNSIRHGGGSGVLLAWRDADALVCEIRDRGHIGDPLIGRRRPEPLAHGGWGVWLANQVCELVQVRGFAGGTAVRMHMRLA